MTRWLQAAKQVSGPPTKPTKPTEPPAIAQPEGVSSVLSVLSEGGQPVLRATRPRGSNPEITPCASDAEAYLAVLLRDGPQTYGAMASILGWGGTRAWQTEARLRAAGLVRYGEFGKAQPTERNTHDNR